MKKLIYWLLLLTLSSNVFAKNIFLYVNGASADDGDWASVQAKKFFAKIKENGFTPQTESKLRYFPIRQGQIISGSGIICMRELSRESFPTKDTRPTFGELNSYYYNLGSKYDNFALTQLENQSCNGIVSATTYIYITSLASEISSIVKNGDVPILIGYSMGNNYIEAALAFGYYKGYITDLGRIKYLGIASPAFSAIGQYVNATLDSVVYETLYQPYSLPSTISYCISPCTAITDSIAELVAEGGVDGHRLLNDYLNDKFFSYSSKERISSLIARKLNDLDKTTVPTISIITASNGSPTTADAVTFSASASSDNGTITAYSWDFGDGTAKSTEASPTHKFTTAGTFTVTLTVTDSAGKQATRQKNITVAGVSPAALQLTDSFSGTSLDATKWNAISGAGGIQYSGTEVTFGGGSYATTQNKVTFSGSKIIVEGRFAGTGASRDTHMELVDVVNGDSIQMGDTDYLGFGFYLYGVGTSFNNIDSTTRIVTSGTGSTSAYMDYRLTVDRNIATIERSNSFADTTQPVTKKTVTLPTSIVGRTFYLRIGTGALVNGYSPGTFDSVSVSVTP